LEGVLNDAKVGDIGRVCFKTYLAEGKYADGFNCVLDGINANIMTNTTDNAPVYNFDWQTNWWIWVIIIVVIIVLAIVTKGRFLGLIFNVVGAVFGFGGGRSGGGGSGGDY